MPSQASPYSFVVDTLQTYVKTEADVVLMTKQPDVENLNDEEISLRAQRALARQQRKK